MTETPETRTAHVTQQLSIVLIDDDRTSREGVIALIRSQPAFRVLAVSTNIEEALAQICETSPDIVVLNLAREGQDALTVAGALRGEAPASRVVMMGMQARDSEVVGLVRAGVAGFLMADATLETVLATFLAVSSGSNVLPLELTGSLFGQLKRHGPSRQTGRTLDIGRLTKRERAVTELIIQGCSNKAIAARLQIALHTVKSHVHKVLSKLSVNSRLEVAAFSRNRPTAVRQRQKIPSESAA